VPAHEPTDLDAAVDALYTRPLDEFIAARDAAVRQATDGGDRLGAQRIKRLPKPSVAAWVINHVARDHPEEVAALADLGDELRAATADRDRGRIRALDHLRRERTEALVRGVREAGEVGGRPVSAAVLDRLTETLTAAVMDPDAAAAVRAGRLARALQHVGFGIVDEQGEEADLVALHPVVGGGRDGAEASDAVSGVGPKRKADAVSGVGPDRKADGEKTEQPKGARGAGQRDPAAADLAEAERAVDEASAQVDQLEARRDDVRERLRTADEAIERGEGEVQRLDHELERLAAERDAARQALDEAREAADEARADLTAVEDELDDAVERSAEARRRRREARGR
jgi:archaellum component FlaC